MRLGKNQFECPFLFIPLIYMCSIYPRPFSFLAHLFSLQPWVLSVRISLSNLVQTFACLVWILLS